MAYSFVILLCMGIERLHIGTSGWSYKHWKGTFYPPKLKAVDWFDWYAQQFASTEINTSFYHLPKLQTVEAWAQKAPPHFTYCPKMSRYITHMKKLQQVEEPLQRFFEIFSPLYSLMGPVLIQLPPMLHFKQELATRFFDLLVTRYPDQSFVLEVRHESWLQDSVAQLLQQYGIGFVISQSAGFFPYAEWVTSTNVYLRFHGPEALYASPYSEDMLHAYALKCKQWLREGRQVWAYFNNDIHGYAYEDARRLIGMLSGT
jgi:uncharacterized protein YecE (DUF72 family)